MPESQAASDEIFMREALNEARKAYSKEEVPVGAVLVFKNKIIARAHNQVELLSDATAHAEMLCLTMGSEALGNWRLLNTVLYCTIEPCAMCAGAMFLSRISRLVYGAKEMRHGAHGSFIDLFSKNHPTHSIEVTEGVLAHSCATLLQDFFKKKRKKNEQSDDTVR
ncbi:MAG: tRNA adenosine(34) deaminase TadA [Chlamydiia bacterium]|nr:tRNA adenosine(34) deaminase TadA [Chlamydiia bacterium]